LTVKKKKTLKYRTIKKYIQIPNVSQNLGTETALLERPAKARGRGGAGARGRGGAGARGRGGAVV